MGLNIGVEVPVQVEGYMSEGRNPNGTREEVEANFDTFLQEELPGAGFSASVSLSEKHYRFDVRLGYRDSNCDSREMLLAIMKFVIAQFGVGYGIDAHIYHHW